MRILVLSLNAWNLSNSTGNTISNLFRGLEDTDEVANIYCRNEAINNTICKKYFRVTEGDIIRCLLTLKSCGTVISYENAGKDKEIHSQGGTNYEKKITILKKYRSTFVLLLRELLWGIPFWKNKKMKKFLKDFSPEIIYMHGHYNLYMHRLLSFCQTITGAKVVMYWADDMYGRKSYAPLSYFYESLLRSRFRKSIMMSSLLFGGSLQLCKEYSNLFGKQFIPFFKECKQVRYDDNKIISNPLTIVYAGNLLFGRESIIVELIKAIDKVNNNNLTHQFLLKVFSNSTPSSESLSYIDDKKNSCFMGCKPYNEVCEQMDMSELVLFIESFRRKDIQTTRLSFSTKIIDCMQSSAGIIAIGPQEIASMDYLTKNQLGYTITDMSEIESKLAYLADHSFIINEMNKKKVEFARKYHTNTSVKALNSIRKLI